ncbi:multifunctional methyltransferase subunit TRM112-like protein [Erpetoichthys calabaricus]|uniref:multifunctional methyltransferase subunit TRM112-like protein n=1 Tax=Erpetoichthys calabaricus TaxID=27687 RepID=UPI0022340293|nr:multifunctional methyltransferase subunit TRM112-like protein [Erpetoichthys calabaricus]
MSFFLRNCVVSSAGIHFTVALNSAWHLLPMLLLSYLRMKLLTHNMLTSHVKGVTKGYPLLIKATEVKVTDVDFNSEFVSRMIPKIEWSVLVEAADTLGHLNDLPRDLPPDYESSEDFLRKVHHVLLEVEVLEGNLKCPESGREFPITKGVPNMLLNEDEV